MTMSDPAGPPQRPITPPGEGGGPAWPAGSLPGHAAPPPGPMLVPGVPGVPPGQVWRFVKPSALPERPEPYARFWRAPRWRWWKGVLVLIAGLAAAVAVQVTLASAVLVLGAALGKQLLPLDGTTNATVFLLNNVGLAAVVPVVLFVVWGIVGQRPGWLGSVIGRLRWRPLLVLIGVLAPLWLLVSVPGFWAGRHDWRIGEQTTLLVVGVLLTTPLQCAGEEYGFRGLVNRAVASTVPGRRLGLVLGAVASMAGFCAAHYAQDLWLNVFYVWFGLVAAWVTHRTGGLEAAIAVHVVNNMVQEVPLPFTDLSGLFERGAGTASFVDLVPVMALLAVAVGVVELLVRRTTWFEPRVGPPNTARPATTPGPTGPVPPPLPGT